MKSRRPQRSLRTILIVMFLAFSILPLAIVTGYSILNYEKAIDNELLQRLSGNAREVSVIFKDYFSVLKQSRDKNITDPSLVYNVSTSNAQALKDIATRWLEADSSSSLSFFDREGRLISSVFRDENGTLRNFLSGGEGDIFLAEDNLNKLKSLNEYALVEAATKRISLILFTKINNSANRHIGYIEQIITINRNFTTRLKERMKLELIFLSGEGDVAVSSNNDFYEYPKGFFKKYFAGGDAAFFDLKIRGLPFGFIMYPLEWGDAPLFLALGASKEDSQAVLRNVNYAFFTVVGFVILLLTITIILTSNVILKPLYELIEAIQNFREGQNPIEIHGTNATEIGLLTDAYNDLSRRVTLARKELTAKISELENTNKDLKEAQSQLVHTAKMASLGQLVAGVAHELNNPIGFIYSNMGHLREYSEKLIEIAETAEKSPDKVSKLNQEYELEYMKTDLPKLISSCEDGARRTRDIVIGLRNFSRLEEAKYKDIDIHESLENTLSLLAGEIKNRIAIHKEFGSVPTINCNAGQINQVLMNILSNAVQAIEGQGQIWLHTKKIESYQGQPAVEIAIQDSGAGMSSQVLEKIFDPFFTTKGVGQGTGLGLSISYGIIESHGGDIRVKSDVGVGTEFRIILPLKTRNKK
ncbi:MAG: sensor histidine kinase [Pseudobdellovibrionaceae bacterium]